MQQRHPFHPRCERRADPIARGGVGILERVDGIFADRFQPQRSRCGGQGLTKLLLEQFHTLLPVGVRFLKRHRIVFEILSFDEAKIEEGVGIECDTVVRQSTPTEGVAKLMRSRAQ